MHIIILNNGFYFTGKIRELRHILQELPAYRQIFASFLRQNLQ